jgi:hypothetical protein
MSKPRTNGGETDTSTDLKQRSASGRASSFFKDEMLGISSRVATDGVLISIHAPADATPTEIAIALDRAEAVTARSMGGGDDS